MEFTIVKNFIKCSLSEILCAIVLCGVTQQFIYFRSHVNLFYLIENDNRTKLINITEIFLPILLTI